MSANHRPQVGSILLNTRTRKSFKVLRIVSNNLVETQGTEFGDEKAIVDSRIIERGLANGSIRRLAESVFDS